VPALIPDWDIVFSARKNLRVRLPLVEFEAFRFHDIPVSYDPAFVQVVELRKLPRHGKYMVRVEIIVETTGIIQASFHEP
jgi:hypothetical protein